MKRSTLLFAQAMGCAILCSLTASAATITGFSASYSPNPEYTDTTPTTSFSGSTATFTNTTLTCASEVNCTGSVLNFSILGTGLDPTQLISVTLDGNLSGTSRATGTLAISASGFQIVSQAFSFAAGNFNTTLLSSTVPYTGNFAFTGVLSLNLLSNQVLTLPSSLAINIGTPASPSAPEPGTIVLLTTGAAGILAFARKRQRQTRTP